MDIKLDGDAMQADMRGTEEWNSREQPRATRAWEKVEPNDRKTFLEAIWLRVEEAVEEGKREVLVNDALRPHNRRNLQWMAQVLTIEGFAVRWPERQEGDQRISSYFTAVW